MSYYCYAHNWASPTYSCPQCHKLHYSASSDSVPSVFTGTVTHSPAEDKSNVTSKPVELLAEEFAHTYIAQIAEFPTPFNGAKEGFIAGYESALKAYRGKK